MRYLLLALLLLSPHADQQPAPDLSQQKILTVFQWIQVLPAPPDDRRPSFHFPLSAYVETQPFGCTNFSLENPTNACPGGFHTGIDMADPQGTPIGAAAPGLAYAFQDNQRYGNHVIVVHPGGFETVYGHMVRTAVSWGQPVTAGQVIGFVGTTGNSTGPHLHFEVRFAGAPLDPMPYLEGAPPDPAVVPAGWPGYPAGDDPLGPG